MPDLRQIRSLCVRLRLMSGPVELAILASLLGRERGAMLADLRPDACPNVAQTTLSHRLALLRVNGLVTRETVGREARFALTEDGRKAVGAAMRLMATA